MKGFKALLILLLMCCILCIFCPRSHAETHITFAWNQISVPDLAGFTLYQRIGEAEYDFNSPTAMIEDPNAREFELKNVPDGENVYWVLRAFDRDGLESDNSNEVNQNQTGAPPIPGSFRIKSIIIIDNVEVP